MAEIPSVFNRQDFVSLLLPGYVPIIAYLLIFSPQLFAEKQISADIFSAVVFVVAGPAIGITLDQFIQGISATGLRIIYRLRGILRIDSSVAPDIFEVRAKMTLEERGEMDNALAFAKFDLSTALGLLGISGLVVLKLGWARSELSVLLGGSTMLLVGAFLHPRSYYTIIRRRVREIIKERYPFARTDA